MLFQQVNNSAVLKVLLQCTGKDVLSESGKQEWKLIPIEIIKIN